MLFGSRSKSRRCTWGNMIYICMWICHESYGILVPHYGPPAKNFIANIETSYVLMLMCVHMDMSWTSKTKNNGINCLWLWIGVNNMSHGKNGEFEHLIQSLDHNIFQIISWKYMYRFMFEVKNLSKLVSFFLGKMSKLVICSCEILYIPYTLCPLHMNL